MFRELLLTTQPENQESRRIVAWKSISFRYTASKELASLFENFRLMCNDAVRLAIQLKPKNRFELIELAYSRLKGYGLHTHYILSAWEVAFAVYRNRRRKGTPYLRKAFAKLYNDSYQLNHLLLRIPTAPRRFIFLTLQASERQISFVDDPNLKRGSVTITEHSVNIAFAKEVQQLQPVGYVGVDVNERNVTVSATNGYEHQFTELGEVAEIKERYREIIAKIGRRTRGDHRVGRKLYAKYGRRERNRTNQRIHKVTRQIVDYAKEKGFGIKMEKLIGIRKLYRRGNGQGASFRGRMNTWAFGETQRQVDYKARWEGVPDWLVNPRGSSSNCPGCGSRVVRLQDRKLYCAVCDKVWDRDDLASKNMMACVVPQERPSERSDEGERGDVGSNPRNGWGKARPDGRKRSTG